MIKDKLIDRTENVPTAQRLITDIHFRAIISAIWSTVINLAYTVYNGYLGFRSGSVWFMTMFIYYAVLFVMRCFVLAQSRSRNRDNDYLIMRTDGVLLLVLTVALTGIISLSLKYNIVNTHGTIAMITLALYTVCKVTVAIVNLVRVRNVSSPIIRTIRDIGFADALVSLISMQLSMYAVFGGIERGRIMFLVSGAIVCAVISVLAVSMLISSRQKKSAK